MAMQPQRSDLITSLCLALDVAVVLTNLLTIYVVRKYTNFDRIDKTTKKRSSLKTFILALSVVELLSVLVPTVLLVVIAHHPRAYSTWFTTYITWCDLFPIAVTSLRLTAVCLCACITWHGMNATIRQVKMTSLEVNQYDNVINACDAIPVRRSNFWNICLSRVWMSAKICSSSNIRGYKKNRVASQSLNSISSNLHKMVSMESLPTSCTMLNIEEDASLSDNNNLVDRSCMFNTIVAGSSLQENSNYSNSVTCGDPQPADRRKTKSPTLCKNNRSCVSRARIQVMFCFFCGSAVWMSFLGYPPPSFWSRDACPSWTRNAINPHDDLAAFDQWVFTVEFSVTAGISLLFITIAVCVTITYFKKFHNDVETRHDDDEDKTQCAASATRARYVEKANGFDIKSVPKKTLRKVLKHHKLCENSNCYNRCVDFPHYCTNIVISDEVKLLSLDTGLERCVESEVIETVYEYPYWDASAFSMKSHCNFNRFRSSGLRNAENSLSIASNNDDETRREYCPYNEVLSPMFFVFVGLSTIFMWLPAVVSNRHCFLIFFMYKLRGK